MGPVGVPATASEHDWTVVCRSADETQQLAALLAEQLGGGEVIAFSGELGAGKTTFIQGLAAGLGAVDVREVLSPTYSLMHAYPLAPASRPVESLIHIDFYRAHDEDELLVLGIVEHLGDRRSVCAIEWAERFPELLPAGHISVELSWHQDIPAARQIRVRGLRWPERCSQARL